MPERFNITRLKKEQAIFILLAFLFLIKLPPLFYSDIQLWDEGMYATRVLSIHVNLDYFDQAGNSVAGFDSGCHPPLLIWLGYFMTVIYGINAVALKIIPLLFGLGSVWLILKIGEKLKNFETGLYAALIFSSTIIFNIFAKRFQFDIPVTFFILLSLYLLFVYRENKVRKYLIYSGVALGLCLMTKALVGLFIPIVLFASLIVLREKLNISIRELIILTGIGIAIALPWHVFMGIKHGSIFTDYLFGFHIYKRAIFGVDDNIKQSGVFYFASYLFTVVPVGAVIIAAMVKDAINYKKLEWKKIFLWVWFVMGLIIITSFRTKVEAYILLILPQACLIIADYLFNGIIRSVFEKASVIFLLLLNLFWFFTAEIRNEIKTYFLNAGAFNLGICIICAVILFLIIYALLTYRVKFNMPAFFKIFIAAFFLTANIYYLVSVPAWENGFELSGIKSYMKDNKKMNVVYISPDFKYNPQFSFYFMGANIGWQSPYNYKLVELKNGIEKARDEINMLNEKEYVVIVEKDNINRGEYADSKLFMGEKFKLISKTHGYELWGN